MDNVIFKGFVYESDSPLVAKTTISGLNFYSNINDYLNKITYNTSVSKIKELQEDIKKLIKELAIDVTKQVNMKYSAARKKESGVYDDSSVINSKTSSTYRKIFDLYKVFTYAIEDYNNNYIEYIEDKINNHLFDAGFEHIVGTYESPNPDNIRFVEDSDKLIMIKNTENDFTQSQFYKDVPNIATILTSNSPLHVQHSKGINFIISETYLRGIYLKELGIHVPIKENQYNKLISDKINEVTMLIGSIIDNLKQNYIKKAISKISNSVGDANIKNKDLEDTINKIRKGDITNDEYKRVIAGLKNPARVSTNPTIKAMGAVAARK